MLFTFNNNMTNMSQEMRILQKYGSKQMTEYARQLWYDFHGLENEYE